MLTHETPGVEAMAMGGATTAPSLEEIAAYADDALQRDLLVRFAGDRIGARRFAVVLATEKTIAVSSGIEEEALDLYPFVQRAIEKRFGLAMTVKVLRRWLVHGSDPRVFCTPDAPQNRRYSVHLELAPGV